MLSPQHVVESLGKVGVVVTPRLLQRLPALTKEGSVFSNILVPLDGSDLGERALRNAESLARIHNASIYLIHVVPSQPELEGAKRGLIAAISAQAAEHQQREAHHLREDRIAGGKEYLEQLAARLRDAGLKVDTAIVEGAVADRILEYAKDHNVDLVAMSTQGYGGIKRRLLGSVTDRVIRSSETPVLVLPADQP